MPVGPARMPLLDHLGELRRRLTIIIVAVIIGTAVFYFATPTIIDLLTDPIAPFVGDKFYIMSSLGGFSLRFSIAIKTAAVVCVPIILWQILGFFLPALKPNERRWVVPTLFLATALFFIGAVFCCIGFLLYFRCRKKSYYALTITLAVIIWAVFRFVLNVDF